MATPTTLPATFTAGQVLTAAQMNDLRGAFRILQVVTATSTTNTTTTSTSFVTSNLSASITPSATSSKVLILVTQGAFYNNAANAEIYATIFRGTVAGTNLATTANVGFATEFPVGVGNVSINFLDSPSTTSAQTYTVGIRSAGGSATANWSYQNSTGIITLLEVSA
jgi:hypothetical protein